MGTYLSTPKTDKEQENGKGKGLEYGMAGMQGWRKTMEDAHIANVALNHNEDTSLFAVFDGHGGAEVAKFCAKYMGQELANLASFRKGDLDSALKEAFHRMDAMLLDEAFASELASFSTASKSPESSEGGEDKDETGILKQIRQLQDLKRMVIQNQSEEGIQYHAGCTAVAALKRNNMLFVANAGDSRGVLCRGETAIALSEDHKPMQESERSRIEAAGGTVNDVGGVARVNSNLNLSRAIGDLKYKLNTSLPPEQQIITAHPDVRIFELTPEDKFFILACDGIWDVMSNQEAVTFVLEGLAKGLEPQQISADLLDACLAGDPKDACGIGCDNMTCIVVLLQGQADML